MMQDNPVAGWTFHLWRDKFVIAFALLLALTLLGVAYWPGILSLTLMVLAAAIWLLVLYFFRNPARAVAHEPGLVVGPCDGKVVAIAAMREDRYLGADTTRLSIFLSVLDVHVQRSPLGGKVALIEHHGGKFLQAFRPEASDVNERISMVIECVHGRILLQQIAGILARRCVNYARPGEELRAGQRFGLIKFGSRVDLYLPPNARILVKTGDQVYGGLTPVARFDGAANQSGE